VTGSRTNALVAGGVLAALAASVLLWRNPAGGPAKSQFAPASIAAEVAQVSVTPRNPPLASTAGTDANATVAAESSGLPLAPTGDYEMAISDAELQAIVEARYGPLVRSLTLSPAASGRLLELLTERQQAAIDVANAAMVAGLNPVRDLATIRQAIALAEADVDADIAREHGASVVAACHEFEATRAERATVDQLAHTVAGAGEPLAPAQQQRLVAVLHRTATPAPVDINGAIFGRFNRRAPLNAQALAAAASELSPRQLEALRHLAPATPPDRTTAN